VRAAMPSPTFNLLYRYDAADRAALVYHLDLYRLNRAHEVWELGWSEFGDPGQLIIIEWPERAEQLLPPDRWDITLDFAAQPDLRELRAIRRGNAPPLPQP
jgi:tRNA threonylcarbamoyl adenosine modification protein YjeE